MIRRVVAQDVHVETGALLNHCQSNSPGANNRDRLASHLIAEEWKKWVPGWPFLLPHQALALPHLTRQHAHHQERELRRRFRQHVGRVRKWNLVLVSVGTVDVIETYRDLRHDF